MMSQRLDKWLWCARFYKTRSLAQAAIAAGHVSVAGQRAKPARGIAPGTHLSVRKPPFEFHLEILALATQRLGAPLAQALYRESAESIAARQRLAEVLRKTAADSPAARPDRRQRRELSALKRQPGSPDPD